SDNCAMRSASSSSPSPMTSGISLLPVPNHNPDVAVRELADFAASSWPRPPLHYGSASLSCCQPTQALLSAHSHCQNLGIRFSELGRLGGPAGHGGGRGDPPGASRWRCLEPEVLKGQVQSHEPMTLLTRADYSAVRCAVISSTSICCSAL